MNVALKAFKRQFEGEIFFDSLYKNLYATDASVYRKLPEAVAFPRSENGIKQLIEFARKNNTSLIPRTAGTSLAGQCVGEGIIVDVSKYFTRIVSLDLGNKTVTVQPGVIRDELNEYLQPHKLFFGPNTSTSNRCMIGGMVGNNSSGTTSIKYGVTRDKVLQLKTILSNGEEVQFSAISKAELLSKTQDKTLEGSIYKVLLDELSSEQAQLEIRNEFPKPEIHRRNTGYAVDSLLDTEVFSNSEEKINLCNLLCGSEGTLAFTTEITLQLDNLPPEHSAVVVSHYASMNDCLNDVLVAMQHDLYTCELMDDIILDRTQENKKYESYRFFVQGNPKALLLLELRSDSKKALDAKTTALIKHLTGAGRSYAVPVLHGAEIDTAMELRKAGLGLLGNMIGDNKAVACIEDTAVALEDLPNFIAEFAELMKGFNQTAVYYAHAGAGEIHLRPILNLKNQEGLAYFRKITTEVAHLTKKYRGSFSGEHGDGIVRGEFLPFLIGEKNYALIKKIKQTFDPHNIFNPEKIVDAMRMDEAIRYKSNRIEPVIPTLMNFDASEGILRLAESCNGSGDCRKTDSAGGTMCPSYHVTKDEKDTTRGRANMLREVLTNNSAINKFNSNELKQTFDLCLSCKACATECPSNVDIATAKAEFQYQYNKENGVSFSTKLFGRSSYYNKRASKTPKFYNWLFSKGFSAAVIKYVGGIAPKRTLPKISTISFSKHIQKPANEYITDYYNVVLFVDEFSNYLEVEIAIDAYKLLNNLGYKVRIVDHLDSARALISKGFLEEAKVEVNRNINDLKDLVGEDTPLLGIEPSAILGFRDEYLRLADDVSSAKNIADNTYIIEEFLAAEMLQGRIDRNLFTSEEKIIKIHAHCHQKALSNQKVTFDILNFPENYRPTIIPSGCCGMAGSFGYEKKHYDLSMKVGELKLFPVVRKANDNIVIAANGTSCRHQIKDGTGRVALHPVSILNRALKL